MKKIIVLCILSVSITSFCQTIKSNESSTSSNQPKVIVFKPDGDASSDKKKEPEFRHMIKVSPLMFFNGDLPLFYELRVGRNSSIEVGAGITNRDYLQEIFDDMNSNGSGSDNNTEYQLGHSLHASFKYWPSKYGALDEGFYFSPSFLYRNYKSVTSYEDYNSTTSNYSTTTYNLDRTIKEFRMLVGWLYYLDDNVFFEYYVGAGLSSISNTYTSTNLEIVAESYTRTKPIYVVGVKIGFSF